MTSILREVVMELSSSNVEFPQTEQPRKRRLAKANFRQPKPEKEQRSKPQRKPGKIVMYRAFSSRILPLVLGLISPTFRLLAKPASRLCTAFSYSPLLRRNSRMSPSKKFILGTFCI
jgi:hypothetical protein